MRREIFLKFFLFVILTTSFSIRTSHAHFGTIIPSDSIVSTGEKNEIRLLLSFTHPFEQLGMPLSKPKSFGVFAGGKKMSLLNHISQTRSLGQTAWQTGFRFRRPGSYIFFMEPEPYWEPAEDCFIIHYTKTVVAAFDYDEGWDAEIGLKTEIVPVTRPFALYTHNLFQGIVKLNGKPVPGAQIEVEYFNQDKKGKAPNNLMITQTIKADSNGLFSYAAPRSGWWGFAALNSADFQLTRQGKKKDVELGAVIWIQFHDWVSR